MKFFILSSLLTLSLSSHAGLVAVANIVGVHGKVFVNNNEAKSGDEISEGQRIELKNDREFVDIKFQNGHIVRLVGATAYTNKINPDQTEFKLERGSIYNIVSKLRKTESFKITDIHGTSFGVRGTQFMLEVKPEKSYLCVCEGTVVAKNKLNSVSVKKDQDLWSKPEKKLAVNKATQMMSSMTKDVIKQMLIYK